MVPDRVKMKRLNKILNTNAIGESCTLLSERLRDLVVGQDEALDSIVTVFQMFRIGMNPPHKPVGTFLFLGPTGSGKTKVVEATANALLGSPRSLTKVDCAEFQHSHEIAKLVGSPPGYLGHKETTPMLSQENLNKYHTENRKISVVLFDEIEKASDSLWALLLGIMDKASMTTGANTQVDFSKCLIFMTSNLGSKEIQNVLTGKGFGYGQKLTTTKTVEQTDAVGLDSARKKFSPEFMNRLDKVVTFRPLTEPQMYRVLEMELNDIQQRIVDAGPDKAFILKVGKSARKYILHQGWDVRYGARHLKRALDRLVVQPIANIMSTGQVLRGDVVEIEYDKDSGRLLFEVTEEGLSEELMEATLKDKAA